MKKIIIGLLSVSLLTPVYAQTEQVERKGFFQSIAQIFKKKDKDKTKKKDKGPKPIKAPVAVKPQPKMVPLDQQPQDSLNFSMMPKFWRKRDKAVINVGLIYYGENYYTDQQMAEIQDLLESRWEQATGGLIKLNTVFRGRLPFKHKLADYPDYTQEVVTDLQRLQRLWYYDNVNMRVAKEVYDLTKGHQRFGKEFPELDMLAVISGAQFDGLGFASGRVAVTENPMEIAWGTKTGGRVDHLSHEKVVDELIHELGHSMALDHTSKQCFRDGITYQEQMECCEKSDSRNDVMSYCRQRNLVDENYFHGFEECNLRKIRDVIVPGMLEGKQWAIENQEECR